MRGLFFACFNSVKPFVHQALNALAHLLIENKCVNALTVYA